MSEKLDVVVDKNKIMYNGPQSKLMDELVNTMDSRGSLHAFQDHLDTTELARCVSVIGRNMHDKNKRMLAMLRGFEWSKILEWDRTGIYMTCPLCGSLITNGHRKDCELAALIREV